MKTFHLIVYLFIKNSWYRVKVNIINKYEINFPRLTDRNFLNEAFLVFDIGHFQFRSRKRDPTWWLLFERKRRGQVNLHVGYREWNQTGDWSKIVSPIGFTQCSTPKLFIKVLHKGSGKKEMKFSIKIGHIWRLGSIYDESERNGFI